MYKQPDRKKKKKSRIIPTGDRGKILHTFRDKSHFLLLLAPSCKILSLFFFFFPLGRPAPPNLTVVTI